MTIVLVSKKHAIRTLRIVHPLLKSSMPFPDTTLVTLLPLHAFKRVDQVSVPNKSSSTDLHQNPRFEIMN